MNKQIEEYLNLYKTSEIVAQQEQFKIKKLLKNHKTTIESVTDYELVKILLFPITKNLRIHEVSIVKNLRKFVALNMTK